MKVVDIPDYIPPGRVHQIWIMHTHETNINLTTGVFPSSLQHFINDRELPRF